MWFWHILVKKIWFQRGLELIKKNHLQRFGLRYCYGQNNKRNWVILYPRNISMTCVSSRADCVKSVQIRNYFWSVFSSIRTEYGEIRTRNNSVFGHFSRSDIYIVFMLYHITSDTCVAAFQLRSWWLDLMILIFTWIDYLKVLGTSLLLRITIL